MDVNFATVIDYNIVIEIHYNHDFEEKCKQLLKMLY
jgi:hypothetical protein